MDIAQEQTHLALQDQEVAIPVQEMSRVSEDTDQQINWRRAQQALKDKEQRIRDLELRLERMYSQAPQQHQAQEAPDVHIADDDILDGKVFRKSTKKMEKDILKSVEALLEKKLRQKDVEGLMARPDYEQVITEYGRELERHYPNLARKLSTDPIDAPLVAYETIINSRFYHEREAQKKASAQSRIAPKQAPTPPSGMAAGASPMSVAKNYQNMAIGEDLWRQYVKDTGYSG